MKEGYEEKHSKLSHIRDDLKAEKERVREKIKHRNKRRVQIITIIVIALFLTGATLAFMPLIQSLRTEEGMQAFKENLETNYTGIEAMLIFFLMQTVQVIIAVIPPVQIVGGVLFGWFVGCLLSFGGTMLGTLVIFVMVSRFGRPLVEAFVNEKHLEKFGFLQNEQKLIRILVILYLIPGIPKDVISYIVPLTPVKKRDFFLYVMPCRLPAIIMSTVLGDNIYDGNIKVVCAVISAALAVGAIGFFTKDKIVAKLKKKH